MTSNSSDNSRLIDGVDQKTPFSRVGSRWRDVVQGFIGLLISNPIFRAMCGRVRLSTDVSELAR